MTAIVLTKLVEHDDDSMTCSFRFDKEGAEILMREGLVSLLLQSAGKYKPKRVAVRKAAKKLAKKAK